MIKGKLWRIRDMQDSSTLRLKHWNRLEPDLYIFFSNMFCIIHRLTKLRGGLAAKALDCGVQSPRFESPLSQRSVFLLVNQVYRPVWIGEWSDNNCMILKCHAQVPYAQCCFASNTTTTLPHSACCKSPIQVWGWWVEHPSGGSRSLSLWRVSGPQLWRHTDSQLLRCWHDFIASAFVAISVLGNSR